MLQDPPSPPLYLTEPSLDPTMCMRAVALSLRVQIVSFCCQSNAMIAAEQNLADCVKTPAAGLGSEPAQVPSLTSGFLEGFVEGGRARVLMGNTEEEDRLLF